MNHRPVPTLSAEPGFGHANGPALLDEDYPVGVPIAADGTFRIADVRPLDAVTFNAGVRYDAGGDGAGDYVRVSNATCVVTAPCAIGAIVLQRVAGSYALP